LRCGTKRLCLLPFEGTEADISSWVSQLNRDRFPGLYQSTLDLGYDGYRQVALLDHLDELGNQHGIVNELKAKQVLRRVSQGTPTAAVVDAITFSFSYTSVSIPPQQEATEPRSDGEEQTPAALNFVSGWDSTAASYIILSPTIIGIMIAIIWPAVAVGQYGADVQMSVQTATSVASFLITAGKHSFVPGLQRLYVLGLTEDITQAHCLSPWQHGTTRSSVRRSRKARCSPEIAAQVFRFL